MLSSLITIAFGLAKCNTIFEVNGTQMTQICQISADHLYLANSPRGESRFFYKMSNKNSANNFSLAELIFLSHFDLLSVTNLNLPLFLAANPKSCKHKLRRTLQFPAVQRNEIQPIQGLPNYNLSIARMH